jgi:hypothetical protein
MAKVPTSPMELLAGLIALPVREFLSLHKQAQNAKLDVLSQEKRKKAKKALAKINKELGSEFKEQKRKSEMEKGAPKARGGKVKKYAKGGGIRKAQTYG